ncbi:efflux RND transporter periplasmic adaptor subunit [Olivibacter domesticus]|uniref:Multidrug efflux pump subunit AcrA (Membrane-fusion protein) n=1 Tax=Olivibacter domesticus TaxID=407022 RepID=A0A1H7QLJ6_OLID1|nr:efflux RND transporter periplasmic adaptor subunit [Olivibacter domesticus]SEL48485.1 Multidrug efflux pump subunit AcrA (membrane-fusion protein) [Olivibacter domesticus]
MKKNFISKIFIGILLLFSWGCSSSDDTTDQHGHHQAIQIDTDIQQLAKPTNQQVIARTPTIRAEHGLKVFPVNVTGRIRYDSKNNTSVSTRVSGRIEHVGIKYNFQAVRKGQLLVMLYSPELVAAQRELLILKNTHDEKLIQSAIQKLQYLGMSHRQVQKVLRSKNVLYRVPVYSPANGYILEQTNSNAAAPSSPATMSANTDNGMGMNGSSTSPSTVSPPPSEATQSVLLREGQYVAAGQTLFNIYTNSDLIAEFALPPSLNTKIQKGKKILFQSIDQESKLYQGEIGLIQPTFNTSENFSLARVYLKSIKLPVGQLLRGTFAITEKQGYWLPKESVVSLGNKSVVFKKEGNVFQPIGIQTGIYTIDQIQILSNIQDWEIAKNASYLIDSEDFIAAEKIKNHE